MASVKLSASVFLSTGLALADATVVVPMAEALALIASGRAAWSAVAITQKFDNVNWKTITALNNGDLASLTSVLLAGVPVDITTVELFIAGEDTPRRYRVVAKGSLTPDNDNVVQPADFDATSNNRVLLRIA